MTLPKTQALKDILRNLGREGRSFSGPRMGVGQEFVSIVRNVEQPTLGALEVKRAEHREPLSRQRVK